MSARGPELPLIQAERMREPEPGLRLPHSRVAQFWGGSAQIAIRYKPRRKDRRVPVLLSSLAIGLITSPPTLL